ncbi:ankyrin repeat domain-containing protein [Planctomycetota bacterium]
MKTNYQTFLIHIVTLIILTIIFITSGCERTSTNSIAVETQSSDPNQSSKYLDAVREFADNVLKYGKDTYGPERTPMFVDGLMVRDPNDPNYGDDGVFKPVEWISPEGERWVLSNLASQQNLFRTLDGLSTITGDPKYKQAAMEAIEYAFENLRSPNGLLYWGVACAYDAGKDRPCSTVNNHSLRFSFPYYELIWEATPDKLRDYIEAFWSAHILDWSNLDMLRYASLTSQITGKGWEHEYEGGPVFSVGEGDCGFIAGSPLYYAAAMLSELSGDKEPFLWSKRLAYRYVETRNSKTGISSNKYLFDNSGLFTISDQFSDIVESHNISFPGLFPAQPKGLCDTATARPLWKFKIRGWISMLLLGELLGPEGEDFKTWALEELTAWGRSAYRVEDNVFIPMFTDGTILEGYVLKKDGYYGAKDTTYQAWHPGLVDFWGYALTYRLTGDEFMWEMVRNMARGNEFGDIGSIAGNEPMIETATNCSEPYALFAFLELYRKTQNREFLKMASRIGDNIIDRRFNKGFFTQSERHVFTRFDDLEHLALLHLYSVIESKDGIVPWVWPDESCFGWDYRQQDNVFDVEIIYTLTDYSEPPISLHEASAIGDLEQVKLLLLKGADVNFRERTMRTPLCRAAMNGHKDIVEFLLANGADVNVRDSWPGDTPLHYAVEQGDREMAELLIAHGADVDVKDYNGRTPFIVALTRIDIDMVKLLVEHGARFDAKLPNGMTVLQYAASQGGSREIVEVLISQGVDTSSFHMAACVGDLSRVKELIEQGTEVDVQDEAGWTALCWAVFTGKTDIAEFLIVEGADINTQIDYDSTLLHEAAQVGSPSLVELLISNGMDVNIQDGQRRTPLFEAASAGHLQVIELLVSRGADVNARALRRLAPLHAAVAAGHKDVVELLIRSGAEVSIRGMGQTPLDMATRRGDTEIIEMLTEEMQNDATQPPPENEAEGESPERTPDPNALSSLTQDANSPDMAAPQDRMGIRAQATRI